MRVWNSFHRNYLLGSIACIASHPTHEKRRNPLEAVSPTVPREQVEFPKLFRIEGNWSFYTKEELT